MSLVVKTSAQLIFRQFSLRVVLSFSCNIDVVVGGSMHLLWLEVCP